MGGPGAPRRLVVSQSQALGSSARLCEGVSRVSAQRPPLCSVRRQQAALCAAVTLPSGAESPAASPRSAGRRVGPSRKARRAQPRRPRPDEEPPASFELLSGDARLVVGTDGSLVLFQSDSACPSARARAIVPWFVARHGATAQLAQPGSPQEGLLELRWGDLARLRVTATSRQDQPALHWTHNLAHGFLVDFAVRPRPGAAHPRDMAELVVDLASAGEWFGGGHTMRQHWPLNDGAWEVGPHYPFDNGPNGLNTLVGHHWVTSSGALVLTDPDTPYLHVGLNSPPPRRNWFSGHVHKISWGVGIQNFTRQILPLSATERRGDGLLRLQARSTYASRRIAHPLSTWIAPAVPEDGAARAGEALRTEGGSNGTQQVAAASALSRSAPQAPLPQLDGDGDAVRSADGAARDVQQLLYSFAHANDDAVSTSFADSGVMLPLAIIPVDAAAPPTGQEGPLGEPATEWLTIRASLCATPHVKAATQMALRTLPRPTGSPLPELLRAPIWTTWARYKAGVTQASVEKFAAEISSRNLPRSVLEIDDRWQAAYGDTAFDADKFPDPAGMVRRLHAAGFKVTLWVMPFVEESSSCYAEGHALGYFVRSESSGGLGLKPGFFRWWNSVPVVGLDVTNPAACAWFVERLQQLQRETGVDGFKFDAGEPCFLPASGFTTHVPLTHPSQYTRGWVTHVARCFDLAEVRTGHHTQHMPLLTRMGDRFSEWGIDNGLGSLIPTLLTSSVLGYPFCLPDMIGGNAYFGRTPSAELMVRWAQASALMPALQFSIAPWDLSAEADVLVRASLEMRRPLIDTIVRLSAEAVDTLEPICLPMWWLEPLDAETWRIGDQFALGTDLVVAPVWQKGGVSRDVYLTRGVWRDNVQPGVTHTGPCWLRDYPAPLDALPIFHRVEA